MKEKLKVQAGKIFLLCIITGFLIAFGYDPLFIMIKKIINEVSDIKAYEDIVATSILGIFYFGILIYFITILSLNFFMKKMFAYLIKVLKEKQLMSPNHKIGKQRSFKSTYEDIGIIFDSFIREYEKVKIEKTKAEKLVDTYLDPSLKKEMAGRNINEIYIGSKKIKATVFFSDLRGFTNFTETHEPEDVVKILNEYFSECTKIITKHGGRVNKYIGDAIMAVFESKSQFAEELDSDKAIIASLDVQIKFQQLAKNWKDTIDPMLNVGLGIGLDRGEIVTGNMGSEERMEYTVIGDTVNTASRICGKALDGQVLITDNVYETVETIVEVDCLSPIEIKGKTGRHFIYCVKTRKMIT